MSISILWPVGSISMTQIHFYPSVIPVCPVFVPTSMLHLYSMCTHELHPYSPRVSSKMVKTTINYFLLPKSGHWVTFGSPSAQVTSSWVLSPTFERTIYWAHMAYGREEEENSKGTLVDFCPILSLVDASDIVASIRKGFSPKDGPN